MNSRMFFICTGIALVALMFMPIFDGCSSGEDCLPQTEDCNGMDDDCDGITDQLANGDPIKRDCSNDCGFGEEICVNGAWEQCSAPQTADETCNGKDDDCDNKTDEDFDCAKSATKKCGTDVGACDYGLQSCGDDCKWSECTGGKTPAAQEDCGNELDDDCNGTVNDGCGCKNGDKTTCCGGTEIVCEQGKWPACPAVTATEECNGKDDDCDNITDEDLPAETYLAGEDVSGLDDCAHAVVLTKPLDENKGEIPLDPAYLYKEYDAEAKAFPVDKDYYYIKAKEDWDLCFANECYDLKVTIAEPEGKDYDFCLVDVGNDPAKTQNTCENPVKKVCTNDGDAATQNVNELIYKWAGKCASNDDRYLYVEVFAKSGKPEDQSCLPYTLKFNFTGVAQDAACPAE